MLRTFRFLIPLAALALSAQLAAAQESAAAKATRAKLKQVITDFNEKETGTKDFFASVNREIDKPLKFEIDNTSGISNNTRLSYKTKKATVEKILNDLSDKYDFGWYVISNAANNKKDGHIVIRKSSKGKERGYEAGKEPKKKAALELLRPREFALALPRWSRSVEMTFERSVQPRRRD